MEQELTKEIAQKLMEIKGEARGVVFKTDTEYILKEKGEEGLKKVEEELKKLGYPIKFKETRTMDFYPVGLRALSLLTIKKVFDFDDGKIKEMGKKAPKISTIIKLFMKYFLSLEKTIGQVSKMWEKHYTIGKLEAEVNEKERYIILRLKDFKIHPVLCKYLEEYFSSVTELIVGSPVTPEERRCDFKKDKFHEFLLTW